MVIVLRRMGLRVETRSVLRVWFDSHVVGEFHPDLVVEGVVVVELKAARQIDPAHIAQVLNYLRASKIEVGLLLNFGAKPQFKRLYYDNVRKARRELPRSVRSVQSVARRKIREIRLIRGEKGSVRSV